MKENKQSSRELWRTVKHVNKCIMESPEEEGREKWNSWRILNISNNNGQKFLNLKRHESIHSINSILPVHFCSFSHFKNIFIYIYPFYGFVYSVLLIDDLILYQQFFLFIYILWVPVLLISYFILFNIIQLFCYICF